MVTEIFKSAVFFTMTSNLIRPQRFELFTDGSFDPQSGLGVGAYLLLVESHDLESCEKVATNSIAASSCARLELMTLLWALDQCAKKCEAVPSDHAPSLVIYTDSKTIVELDGRRARLEAKQFASGRTGLPLSNGDLYQEFFRVRDRLSRSFVLTFTWVKGHSKKGVETREQAIFARVDREARQVLRQLR